MHFRTKVCCHAVTSFNLKCEPAMDTVKKKIMFLLTHLFRPTGGEGIEGQCTTLNSEGNILMEQNCLGWFEKPKQKPKQALILGLNVTTLLLFTKPIQSSFFELSKLYIYIFNCVEKYSLYFLFKMCVLTNTILF